MPDYNTESVQINEAAKAGANQENEALINRLASDMLGARPLAVENAAPDNKIARYGLATAKGLAHLPGGTWDSIKHHAENPMDAVAAVGMGAGMAVVLKSVLPKAGMAGKVASVAIGGYFTMKAVEPLADAYSNVRLAESMDDLDKASQQIGRAGGDFAVGTVLAAGGYKLGARATDAMLATTTGSKFINARDTLYSSIGEKSVQLGQSVGLLSHSHMGRPGAFGVVPPYLLDDLARLHKDNPAFKNTLDQTIALQNARTTQFAPRMMEDFKGARELYDAQGRQQLPGKLVRKEGEGPIGNKEGDNAFDFTGNVREYFKEVHGRNSIDGNGMKLQSTFNYGRNYENAFWDGTRMTYGSPGAASPFRTFVLLDVAAHEVSHGVTQFRGEMRYRGQSGALNEHMSDVMGSLVKQWTLKQPVEKADWLIGEGIWKDTVKGGKALRDMKNPGKAYDDPAIGKDPQPGHMDQYVKTRGDNGGVHYNSGIPNRAFANFAEAVGGNAWEAPGKIWYAAAEQAAIATKSNPSFAQFAHHTIEQARALGHADKIPALQKAWEGVGVKPDANAVDVHTPSGGGWGDDLARFLRRTG